MFVGKCFLVVAFVCVICPYGILSSPSESYEDGKEPDDFQHKDHSFQDHNEHKAAYGELSKSSEEKTKESQQSVEEYNKKLAECDQLRKQLDLDKNGGAQATAAQPDAQTHRVEAQSPGETSENPSLWNQAQGLLGLSSEAPNTNAENHQAPAENPNDNHHHHRPEDGHLSSDKPTVSPSEEPPKNIVQQVVAAGSKFLGLEKGPESSTDQTPEDDSSLLQHAINILKELQAMEREIVRSQKSGEKLAGRTKENADLLGRVRDFLGHVYEKSSESAAKREAERDGFLRRIGNIFGRFINVLNPKGDKEAVKLDPNVLEGELSLKLNEKPIAIPSDENIWSKIWHLLTSVPVDTLIRLLHIVYITG